jgi:hypothetical protein
MPKRYQISLPFWLSDYLEELVESSGVTASEMSKILICMGIMVGVSARWPEYPIEFKELPPEYFIKNFELADKKIRKRFWASHEFEAQKALEYYKAHIAELIDEVQKRSK